MAVGLSDGTGYENNEEWLSSTTSTMPPGASTEPAGALKSTEGTTPTPESTNTRNTNPSKGPVTVNPWVTITPQDIDQGIGIAESFGTGTMQGVKSATFDRAALYKAQNLEMDGTHADDIWNQTQTFRGADGRWRQEIPDQDLNILDKGTTLHPATPDVGWTTLGAPETLSVNPSKAVLPKDANLEDIWNFMKARTDDVRLKDVLDHPALYEAYPHLQDLHVEPMPQGLPYHGMVRGNTIFMKELPVEAFTSTLMHEVQHLVQNHEGFSTGANQNMFLPPELAPAKAQFLKIKADAEAKTMQDLKTDNPKTIQSIKQVINAEQEGWLKDGDPLFQPARDQLDRLKQDHPEVYQRMSNVVKSEKLIADAEGSAYQKYKSVMGEVESRNVQARLNMSDMNRLLQSPQTTEEMLMPRSQQINSTDIASHRIGR